MNSLLLVLLFSSSINVSMSFLSRVSETQFNQTKAKELWIMNAAASCNPDRLAKWDVATIANYFPNIRSVSVFQNITGENLGYTAYNPDTNEIIMSFRGSENTENWIEDIDFLKSDFSKCQVQKTII